MKSFISLAHIVLLFSICVPENGNANSNNTRRIMAKPINENQKIRLKGNTPAEAKLQKYRAARVHPFQKFSRIQILLKRSPQSEEALKQRIESLHDKSSPDFQKWLTVEELRSSYGPSESDINTVVGWLNGHGFEIDAVHPNGLIIEFSGLASQIENTFGTEIHHLNVDGVPHISNISDYAIPLGLVDVVAGVVSLNDFFPLPNHAAKPQYTFTNLGQTKYGLVPGDIARIYNLNPLFQNGIAGKGQTIVLIENSKVYDENDFWTFRSKFGLSSFPHATFAEIHPPSPGGTNNCTVPGVLGNGFALEATLDAQWASAAAPNAAIVLASCADSQTTFGGLIALQNLLNSGNPPAIVSVSFGQCETRNGAARNAAYFAAYQQAAALGTSVFVSAGDSGSASCDQGSSAATNGITVNALASTPYNVAVGGTDFVDTYLGASNSYWSSTNDLSYTSALSYIPETPWNSTCASKLLSTYNGFSLEFGSSSMCNSSIGSFHRLSKGAGGGGPSACATGVPESGNRVGGTCAGYPKPVWQSMLGVPQDGVRGLPDVSLFAANGAWGHYYVTCYSNPSDGGKSCAGEPSTWTGAGGTSFGAPILAGIQALINQYTAVRHGNPNPVYYAIASAQYGNAGNSSCNSILGASVGSSCTFYDVTFGDIQVPCTGSVNCYASSGTYGVSSTSSSFFESAFEAKTGWDFTTGIGTPNAKNLLTSFASYINPPRFTNLATATFEVGSQSSFSVNTAGFPSALPVQIWISGVFLPLGIGFVDIGNGSAALTGNPPVGSGNTFSFRINAANGLQNTFQNFALVVRERPKITSASSTIFTSSIPNQFVIQSLGYPKPTISITPNLPNGFSFVNHGNGTATISATPTQGSEGKYTITVNSENDLGINTQVLDIIVADTPKMTSLKKALFTVNSANLFSITASGYPPAIISTSSIFPNSLVFNNQQNGSASISGTPTLSDLGIYLLELSLDNGISPIVTENVELIVGKPISISAPLSANFEPNQPALLSISVDGYPAPTCSTKSNLPGGVQFLDNKDGTVKIFGTPSSGSQGTYSVVVDCKNGYFEDKSRSLTLYVVEAPKITTADSSIFKVGQEFMFTIRTTGYPTPLITLNAPLPPGLTFNNSGSNSATISGKPLPGSEGKYDLVVTAKNAAFAATNQNFRLTINRAPEITSAPQASFKAGEANLFLITTIAYPNPRISVSPALPNGISISDKFDGTAQISGTPASNAAGTYTFTISAANGIVSNATQEFSLTITKSSASNNPVAVNSGPSTSPSAASSGGCATVSSDVNDTVLYLILMCLFLGVRKRTRKNSLLNQGR